MKVKKISALILSLFILLNLTGCDSQKYNKAISHIEDKEWNMAIDTLKQIPDYKNSKHLLAFVKANKYLEDSEGSVETYKKAVELAYDVPDSWVDGELSQEISDFQVSIKATYEKMSDLEEVKNFIIKGDYDEATFKTISKHQEGDKDYSALYNYACALKSEKEGDLDMMKLYLASIPDDYDGLLNEQITSKTVQYYDEITEKRRYINMKDPSIGMTAEEVRNSTWGRPQDINTTTTASGVSEQWVYSGYRYIYLENGIVTAIQE